MRLAESIAFLRRMLGRGEKSQADERRYRIELQALMDVYEGNPFDDQRWNVTEAYVYREAWERGIDQLAIEGRGFFNERGNA